MNTSTQPSNPNSEDHANTSWPADIKRPIIGAPVPVGYMSMPGATVNMLPEGLMYARAPGFVDPALIHPNVTAAGHFGMVQHHHHHQPGWSQTYPPFMVTPPVTPPNQAAAVYDAHVRGRAPGLPQAQAQTHGHMAHPVYGAQGQQQHIVYVNQNHPNIAYLRAQQQAQLAQLAQQQQQAQQQAQQQQSEKALAAQFQAKLSLQETEKKSSVAATTTTTAPAPTVSATATTAAETPARTLPIPAPIVAEAISTGSTDLTIIPAGATRTILGPDGNTLVPPPDPAHPGCELSEPMSQALKNFDIEHVCDYMVAKDLLRDKIVNQVLENTKEKLMELLQNELDRMAAEEDDDEEEDFDCEDEDEETAGLDWTRLKG
ncbi:hypothetical protein B0T20DRAFT_96797 [Sordaria brevicollis]|uniref:Uncharacterized protein n=1 Tax=Sordaria brevicollis TaxID=83679 RepID=A0AAE0NVJ3_SORBR|nr:hypothetical protein B0T20DRAFT_96797 [Sordaria brevicollis]